MANPVHKVGMPEFVTAIVPLIVPRRKGTYSLAECIEKLSLEEGWYEIVIERPYALLVTAITGNIQKGDLRHTSLSLKALLTPRETTQWNKIRSKISGGKLRMCIFLAGVYTRLASCGVTLCNTTAKGRSRRGQAVIPYNKIVV